MPWYRGHYRSSQGALRVGEVAPTYFASPEACRRIKDLIPTAKIICTFRNPVERIVSLYRVKRAYGLIPWNFEEALLRDRELMESSRYATHLREWRRRFGSDRLLATFYDDLRDTPQAYVDRLADFIGIPRFTLTSSEIRATYSSEGMTHPRSYYRTHHASRLADWLKVRRLGRFVLMVNSSPLKKLFLGGGPAFEQPPPVMLQMIWEFLRHEVEELETMLNRDLSAWKSRSAILWGSQMYSRAAIRRDCDDPPQRPYSAAS